MLTSLSLPIILAKNKVTSYRAAHMAGCKEECMVKFKCKLATRALVMGEILMPH